MKHPPSPAPPAAVAAPPAPPEPKALPPPPPPPPPARTRICARVVGVSAAARAASWLDDWQTLKSVTVWVRSQPRQGSPVAVVTTDEPPPWPLLTLDWAPFGRPL